MGRPRISPPVRSADWLDRTHKFRWKRLELMDSALKGLGLECDHLLGIAPPSTARIRGWLWSRKPLEYGEPVEIELDQLSEGVHRKINFGLQQRLEDDVPVSFREVLGAVDPTRAVRSAQQLAQLIGEPLGSLSLRRLIHLALVFRMQHQSLIKHVFGMRPHPRQRVKRIRRIMTACRIMTA
jgi:hypothetical protein